MFIQTEQTPNPATIKFIPGEPVLAAGTLNFPSAEAAERSPLATRLFRIDGVTQVFLADDFISVSKSDDSEWDVLKPLILAGIMEHYTSGQPVVREAEAAASDEEESELVRDIKELLETKVRPAVAQDGGDIVFDRFEGGVVYVHLQGACAGCPSANATLKSGIENMLKYYVPEVEAVEAVA